MIFAIKDYFGFMTLDDDKWLFKLIGDDTLACSLKKLIGDE
jgi:hypothetical protein